MAPVPWNGSQVLYRRLVRPLFLKHEATVDSMVCDLSGKAITTAESVTREGMRRIFALFLIEWHSVESFRGFSVIDGWMDADFVNINTHNIVMHFIAN